MAGITHEVFSVIITTSSYFTLNHVVDVGVTVPIESERPCLRKHIHCDPFNSVLPSSIKD